ncbi:hypothetical protein BM523_15145 [Alteromonas mediterranea]|jgi:hypothetical protein|uniref:DUF2333 domain-containing protein n=1 Tax=Alteromonas mediterranea TaxID=314275 RepID=A0AAC9JDN4_9ALTE|nr:DUF2333 family protein [Alteromonas mediterranea]MBR9898175.1 DUF2333 family protein [Gammaproteobacteria bacterium]MEA3379751.1 DUF2333 family protein [Pseudomonadota bacterium]APD91002.1 hypothetical protein BM524_15030 [Alteromonas mediterranea]APD95227.1 hypothetical protein BM523_15145 [Alteromonas mediterranea]APD98864.1 hypothetical protein BM525_15220 [Alteromonas mediterranea]|tara:strand:- start:2217 stop:3209 length:993 start_codon:yes stop_codon:yes gene_type:complete
MRQSINSKRIAIVAVVIFLLFWLIGWYWSLSPDTFDIRKRLEQNSSVENPTNIAGYTLTTTMIDVSETLLNKPGGYLSNDVIPPSVFLDNMPAWEFGALEMVRDLALSMRKDFSRSQSQSIENPYLTKAHPKFNMDHKSWALPSSESSYAEGIELLKKYRDELANTRNSDSQFYTRADNLREWLKQVEKRLGSYSQRLSASVGSARINTDLAGDANAKQSTPSTNQRVVQTSWWKLDNNFYEARGATWALLHFLKAVEIEFNDVLEDKNALVSLQQIIRELEATQQSVFSPMILNGSGFGMLANHSLVMANYISRANAALIEISELLNQG